MSEPSLQSRPHSSLPSGIDADTMAKQTITCMNVLAEHAAAIRAHLKSKGAYERIIDQGCVLLPQTKWSSLDCQGQDNLCHQMEAIIHRPVTTVEE